MTLDPRRPAPTFPADLLILAALASLGTLGLVLVLERLGTPAATLIAAGSWLLLGLFALAGAAGGTMRWAIWRSAQGALDAASATLMLTFLAAFGWPQAPPLAVALGLAAGALVLAPALRAQGSPSLARWLGDAHRSPAVLILAGLLGAAISLGLGADAFARAITDMAAPMGWDRDRVAVALGAGLVLAVVPGGARGIARAALALTPVILLAALAQGQGSIPSPAEAGARLAEPFLSLDGAMAGLAVALGMIVLPPFTLAAIAAADAVQARDAWLRAAAITMILALLGIGVATAPGLGDGRLDPTIPVLATRVLGAAGAMLAATASAFTLAVALGDVVGAREVRFASLSRRFAWHRLAAIGAVAACAAVALRIPTVNPALPAMGLAVAGLLPVVLVARLGLPVSAPGSCVAMLAVPGLAALLVTDRFKAVPLGLGPALLAGAACGGIVAWLAGLMPTALNTKGHSQ